MVEKRQRKKRKSELRRESIIQNALKIFDRRGFANTSLDDIARETGVKREAIYYYFNNREEILLNIIRPQSENLVQGLRQIVASKDKCADKLFLAVRNHLESFDRHCLEMTVSLRDVYLEDAKAVRREMGKIWRSYELMWTELIAEGQRAGEFSNIGEPKMLAFGILGMCNWLARWYDPKKSVNIDELVQTYFNMMAHGLISNPVRNPAPGTVADPAKQKAKTSAPVREPRRARVEVV